MSTAAVPFNNANTIETFSSRGPVSTYFTPVNGGTPGTPLTQNLAKPDIAATDGGLTTFFGGPVVGRIPVLRHLGCGAGRRRGRGAPARGEPGAERRPGQAGPDRDREPGRRVRRDGGRRRPRQRARRRARQPAGAADGRRLRPDATNDSTPTFTITNTGDAKTTTCQVDGAAAAGCASPFTTGALAEGAHTLGVAVADYFGGSGSDAISFTVDLKAPNLKIKKGPKKKIAKKKAKFKFETDADASLSCQLDKKAAAPCGTNAKFKVKRGQAQADRDRDRRRRQQRERGLQVEAHLDGGGA